MIADPREWTAEEDALIKMLIEQRGIEDWSEIARLARDEYHFPLKNSKDYR